MTARCATLAGQPAIEDYGFAAASDFKGRLPFDERQRRLALGLQGLQRARDLMALK